MSEDLIRRSDAIKALDANFTIKGKENMQTVLNYLELVRTRIEGAPTIEPKTKVVAQITFDEEKLREIVKKAVERFKEEYEITDRPQGEWIYTNNPLRLDDEWECSRCGNISFVKTNFCDRCGAKMKGADDK